jgi:hypothetical protein
MKMQNYPEPKPKHTPALNSCLPIQQIQVPAKASQALAEHVKGPGDIVGQQMLQPVLKVNQAAPDTTPSGLESLNDHQGDTHNQNRSLADLETDIARSGSETAHALQARRQMALALVEIHKRKLYKKDYASFESYLTRRWRFSRSRGYQLLHFGRRIAMSTTVDNCGPETERQARLLDSEGRPCRQKGEDTVMLAMNYLVKAYENLPLTEREDFVEDLMELLREMQKELASLCSNAHENCSNAPENT